DAWPQAARLPFAPGLLEGVERLAVGEVAYRVHGDGEARGGAAADDLDQLLAARDLDAGAVQHAGRLRPERSVHESLQVADANELVSEAASDVERGELFDLLRRQRLPHAQVKRAFVAQPLPDAERAEPAVLVVHRGDAARNRDPDSLPRGVDHLFLRRPDVRVPEVPRAL